MFALLLAAILIQQAAPPAAATGQGSGKPASVPPSSRADAYYQFLLGRSYEANGETELAISAFRAAASAEPGAAEIRAELAALYARQNQPREAMTEGQAALNLDPANREAHKVLGLVYAALARPEEQSSRGDSERAKYAGEAIDHFEAMAGDDVKSLEPGIRVTLARLYMLSGTPAKAVPLLTGLLDEVPEAAELVPMLADAYAGAGQVDQAIAVLEEEAAKRPGLLGALASLYERQGRWSDAVRAYEKAVAAFPRNTDLGTRLAFALLNDTERPNPRRAREVLEAALKDSPNDTRILYLLTEAQRLTRDHAAAEATARQLLRLQPGSLWGASALAEVLAERREYRKVVEELAPLVDSAPPEKDAARGRQLRDVLTELGLAYQELGDHAKAVATFDRLAPLFGDDATGELYRVQARLAAGRFEEALTLARAVRGRFPRDPRPVRLEADALRQSGRAEEGARLLESEVQARPDDLMARLALAELLLNARLLDRAEALLRETVSRFPASELALFQLGAVLERQKRFDEAESTFRAVLAKSPDHALALNYLGYMLADRGRKLDEAVTLIRRAVDADPYNGSYLDSLGWAYFRQGKYDAAEPLLRRAAEQQPRNSIVQAHFGDLLERLGRLDEAVTRWRQALDGDGEDLDRAAVERKIANARARNVRR